MGRAIFGNSPIHQNDNYISTTLNKPNNFFKEKLSSGSDESCCVKLVSYLGYRLVSIIMLPINTIGLLVMLALSILTSPLALCECSSAVPKYLINNALNFGFCLLMDSTYELRKLAWVACGIINGLCCDCGINSESPYFHAI